MFIYKLIRVLILPLGSPTVHVILCKESLITYYCDMFYPEKKGNFIIVIPDWPQFIFLYYRMYYYQFLMSKVGDLRKLRRKLVKIELWTNFIIVIHGDVNSRKFPDLIKGMWPDRNILPYLSSSVVRESLFVKGRGSRSGFDKTRSNDNYL